MKPFARKYPRVKIDLEVNQVVGGMAIGSRLLNISAGGALLADPLVPVWGEPLIVIEIKIPDRPQIINAKGRIVRDVESEGQHQVAIEFIEIDKDDQTTLADFIEQRRRARTGA